METLGSRNPSELHRCQGCLGDPVNTATGNFFEEFTDLAVPGRGVPLTLSRTYNSLAAGVNGPLGVKVYRGEAVSVVSASWGATRHSGSRNRSTRIPIALAPC
ncbi:MAG: DUF6531 domain-containing protein [bacterium]